MYSEIRKTCAICHPKRKFSWKQYIREVFCIHHFVTIDRWDSDPETGIDRPIPSITACHKCDLNMDAY